MNLNHLGSLLLAVTLIGFVGLRSAEPAFVLPPETATLKPGAGADLAKGKCLLCHSADYIATQPPLSQAAWKAAVVKMQQRFGAPILTNEIDPLADYLWKQYGTQPTQK